MDEYIRKQDALDCFHTWVDKYGDVNLPDDMPEYRAIENLPAADVVERKKGKWIHFSKSDKCSVCGYDTGKYEAPTWFCPKCGADMRGET